MKYIVIQLDDGGDLRREEFDSKEDADMYLETHENKAYLVEINGTYKIEDHT